MKKLLALGGVISSVVLFVSLSIIIPRGAIVTLVLVGGGVAVLVGGIGAVIVQFILTFFVGSGLTLTDILITL
jgi:hypothetical protein